MSRFNGTSLYHETIHGLVELFKRGMDYQYILYRLKWNSFPKYHIVSRFPLHVDIEATDSCNLRCIMCVHGQGGVKDTGFIETALAKHLIDQVAEGGAYSIKFNWRGEPALHPDLVELVRYAKRRRVLEVQFNTNGIPFSEKKVRDLIDAGLDRVIFSVDGATASTYEKIRVGGRFDTLADHIKLFHRVKQEKRRVKPFARIQMVRMKENEKEMEAFKAFWSPFADDIRISNVTNRGQGDHLSIGDQEAVGRRCCPQPWQRMVVGWDGKVVACCSDWFRTWIVGDATRERLQDIWRSPSMEEIRRLNREVRLDEVEPCKSCFSLGSYVWKKVKQDGHRNDTGR